MHRIVIWIVTLFFLVPASAWSSDNGSQLTLVVGFAPGGNSSTAARIIAESVESTSGETVVVENRPGAGGAIAADWVARQRGSNTLFFMSATSVLKVPTDLGLIPIGIVATYKYVVVARKNTPPTLAQYMQAASRDDKFRNVATPGAGSIPHLIGARLFEQKGIPMVHIPFQGSAPAILSVVGGHVPLAIVPFTDFLPFKDSLNILAETGNGIDAGGWVGIFAAPGTTDEEAARLSEMFRQASVRSAAVLGQVGFQQAWKSGEELQSVHQKDRALWLPVVEKLGIQP